jgi:adenosylhomocysteinase
MNYKVKDISLADQGNLKISWAESRMPVLMSLREKYKRTRPLDGIKIAGCLHVTKETAVLAKTLKDAGARVSWCGCNPLSTQDDVAAALAKEGISVYAWRGLSTEEYYWCIERVLETEPNITLDDGADLVFTLHKKLPGLIKKVYGGTEETTTGVKRLRSMANDEKLKYPVIAVNDAETKWEFDNVHGTGQSSLDGIMRATNILIAGKNVVVSGYGHCGRGIASRAKGLGASVIITEVNPINALKARLDGFEVMRMIEAAKIGDVFITATGSKSVINKEHMMLMKDGAILANAGHFNVEVSVEDLEKIAENKRTMRSNNVEYLVNEKRLYLIAEGRLVNLAAAEGHPSEVMDMSFANQFLSILYLANNRSLEPKVYNIPKGQDETVARIKLETMGIKIDELTEEQKEYISSYEEGT